MSVSHLVPGGSYAVDISVGNITMSGRIIDTDSTSRGTWTPTLIRIGDGNVVNGFSLGTASGYYSVFGDQCTIHMTLVCGFNDTSSLGIGGLPFPRNPSYPAYGYVAFGNQSGVIDPGYGVTLGTNTNYADLYSLRLVKSVTGANMAPLAATDTIVSAEFKCSMTYTCSFV